LPSYTAVFRELVEQKALPAFTRLVFGTDAILIGVQIAIIGLVWLAVLAYVGGPRLRGWLNRILPGLSDRIQWQFPWRRKRLQRDFSALLAILLDAQVPESEAVSLAGESTANTACRFRAGNAGALLKQGIKLPQAIRAVDDSKEFGWRLANALRRGGGFLRALTGWHETLDARAFQLEQSAAQLTTTALVLLNGLFVGCVVIAVFLALIQILNEAVLW